MKFKFYILAILMLLIVFLVTFLIITTNTKNESEPLSQSNEIIKLPVTPAEDISIPNNSNTQITLFDGYVVAPSDQIKVLFDYIYLDVYAIFGCQNASSTEQVLRLTAKYTQSQQGNHLRDVGEALLNWEPFIYKDVGRILFPQEAVAANTRLVFTSISNDGIRSARFRVNGNERTIFYGWHQNQILFAPSLECLYGTIEATSEDV